MRNRSGVSQSSPAVSFTSNEIADRVFGGADAAGQLDAAPISSGGSEIRTASRHDQRDRRVAAGVTLPVEVLMKSPPASKASQDARRNIVQSGQLAGLQNYLQMRRATGLFHRDDLVDTVL